MKRASKKVKVLCFFLAALALVSAAAFFMANRKLPAVTPGMGKAEIAALRYPGYAWSLQLTAMMKAGPDILPPDFDTGIPPPPANDSDVTKGEIRALHEMERTERTELQLMRINFEDTVKNPCQIFAKHELMNLYDKPVYDLTFAILWDVTYFLLHEKDKYARPRPSQLDSSLTTVVPVPAHPSYPNANAGQAYAVALVMGMLDPARKDAYEQLAADVGHRREVAGLHYPSDTAAGRLLTKNVVDALMKTEKIRALYEAARREHPEWEKKTVRAVLLALLFLLPGIAHAAGALYVIDPDQTHVRFAAKMCLADILMGEFHDVKGTFYFDEQHPDKSYVNVTIGTGSATFSKEAHKGEAVKDIVSGERFLKVKDFPLVTFKSTKVKKTSSITADVTGDMTLLGVTRPFSMEITFHDDVGMTAAGRKVAAFSAYGKFRRSGYGIVYGLDRTGIRRMDDEVTVLIDAAGNRRD